MVTTACDPVAEIGVFAASRNTARLIAREAVPGALAMNVSVKAFPFAAIPGAPGGRVAVI